MPMIPPFVVELPHQALQSRTVRHVTLSTGHSRLSAKSEISEEILTSPSVRALLHEGGEIPAVGAGYELRWTAPPGAGCCVYTVYREGVPLVTCGVAGEDAAGEQLWSMLSDLSVRAGQEVRAVRPAVPWCGVVLLPGIITDPGALEWLGDFERVIAWAWLTDQPQQGT